MPRMTTKPEPAATAPLVLNTDPDGLDDIPDPAVPPAVMEALDTERPIDDPAPAEDPPAYLDLSTLEHKILMVADSALFKLSEHGATLFKHLDNGFSAAIGRLDVNRAALDALTQAVAQHRPLVPYSATVSTVTPSGYPVSFTVQESSQAAFLEALGGLLGWVKAQGFSPLTLPQVG